ncbi:MAG: pitrilysin family protein [bacterium]
MNFKKKTLPNGLRIITVPTKGNPSVTVMVLTETGSNYEKKSENGLSHFLEHMIFKGTPKRPSPSIIHREMDSMGAQGNAFTDDEVTAYYAKAEKRQWKRALDLISDMYQHPLIPEADLEKERGVILQEINMQGDRPQRQVWDLLSEVLYGDNPAGWTTLGPKENIRSFKREDFIKYHQKHYTAEKTIVVVVGDLIGTEVKKEASRLFKNIPRGNKVGKLAVRKSQKTPALKVLKKKTEQTHMVVALHALNASDKRTHILAILSAVLGSGFSSRLFEKLRDEMGACYYVRAISDEYTDHGYLAIGTGIEAKRAKEVLSTVLHECKRFTTELVPKEELQKAKDYVAGNLFLGLETSDSLAGFYALSEVARGDLETPKQGEEKLRSVTAIQIRKLAKEIFQNKNLNLAIVGDIKDTKGLKKVLKF